MRIIETQHSQAYTHSGRVRPLLVHKISTQAVASGAPHFLQYAHAWRIGCKSNINRDARRDKCCKIKQANTAGT